MRMYSGEGMKGGDWTEFAKHIGIPVGSVHLIASFLQNLVTPELLTGAEVVFRLWQYLYNESNKIPDPPLHMKRPNYPCTKEAMIEVLYKIGRYDLADLVAERVFSAGYVVGIFMKDAPEPDTLQLPTDIRTEICMRMYPVEGNKCADWRAFAEHIGMSKNTAKLIQSFLEKQVTPKSLMCAEVVLRYWQYVHNRCNKFNHLPPGIIKRSTYPCTRGSMLEIFKKMKRGDLAKILKERLEHV